MRRAITAMLVVLGVAGCSAQPPGPPGVTDSGAGTMGSVSAPPTSPPVEAAPPADLVPYVQSGHAEDVADFTVDGHVEFMTPSGNIYCVFSTVGGASVLCEVQQQSWPPIPTPTCGDGISFSPNYAFADGTGVGRGGCYGGAPFVSYDGQTLSYGSMISDGGIACRSESAFLACVHLATGNGFAISRTLFEPYGTARPPAGNA